MRAFVLPQRILSRNTHDLVGSLRGVPSVAIICRDDGQCASVEASDPLLTEGPRDGHQGVTNDDLFAYHHARQIRGAVMRSKNAAAEAVVKRRQYDEPGDRSARACSVDALYEP